MDIHSLDFSQGDDSVQQFAISPGGYLELARHLHTPLVTHNTQLTLDDRLRLRLDETMTCPASYHLRKRSWWDEVRWMSRPLLLNTR